MTKWAEYLEGKGARSGEPALHRRFRRPPGAQRQPLDQGHPGAGLVRDAVRDDRAQSDEAAEYRDDRAASSRAKWVEMAADGDHYRLAFDKPGTWSQKYNLVWDKLLGLNLFPAEVAAKGNRLLQDQAEPHTACRWTTAKTTPSSTGSCGPRRWPTIAADFEALVAPVYRFANESPSRVPLTDWYDTDTAKQQGFQARSVVGGVFIKMLADPAMWKKYASRRP